MTDVIGSCILSRITFIRDNARQNLLCLHHNRNNNLHKEEEMWNKSRNGKELWADPFRNLWISQSTSIVLPVYDGLQKSLSNNNKKTVLKHWFTHNLILYIIY